MPGALRTDPDERNYRIRLLTGVMAARRWWGHGWQIFAGGSQRETNLAIRDHGVRSAWLRRLIARPQYHPIQWRNAQIARPLSGTPK